MTETTITIGLIRRLLPFTAIGDFEEQLAEATPGELRELAELWGAHALYGHLPDVPHRRPDEGD